MLMIRFELLVPSVFDHVCIEGRGQFQRSFGGSPIPIRSAPSRLFEWLIVLD